MKEQLELLKQSKVLAHYVHTLAVERLGTAADLTIADLQRSDGTVLTLNVEIATTTGHKFPTGLPPRRAWVHLTVQDASGKTVLESGAPQSD